MSIPMDPLMRAKLKSAKPSGDTIREAHQFLISNGYKFVGYHGTNLAHQKSIVPDGFNTKFIGTGDGTARGLGFYVSRRYELALDYASSSTQSGDPIPPSFIPQRHTGDYGQPRLLRIYLKDSETLSLGTDYKWGIQSSGKVVNGDLSLDDKTGRDTGELDKDDNVVGIKRISDLELIVCGSVYPQLAAIPSKRITVTLNPFHSSGRIVVTKGGRLLDKELDLDRLEWDSYEIDKQLAEVLSKEQLQWQTKEEVKKMAELPGNTAKRRNSDPSALSSMEEWRNVKNSPGLVFTSTMGQNYQKGYEFYHGQGVTQDMQKAAQYLMLAAKEGHPGAQEMLADIYQAGRGVAPDIKEAIRLRLLSAQQGNVQALFSLGVCCEKGLGVAKNLALAAELYQAAKRRRYEGWTGYVEKFMKEHHELNSHFSESTLNASNWAKYFTEAISQEKGQKDLYHLKNEQRKDNNYQQGLRFYHGTKVPVDMKRAKGFFELAAEEGHAGAQDMLADILMHGRAGEYNIEKAVQLFQRSAEQENPHALFALGECYETGKGVPKNFVKAAELYKKSKKRGYEGRTGHYDRFFQAHLELQDGYQKPLNDDNGKQTTTQTQERTSLFSRVRSLWS